MKKLTLILSVAMTATFILQSAEANAQLLRRRGVMYAGRDIEGMTQVQDVRLVNPAKTAVLGATDPYSPRPYYAYSNRGVESGLIHQWNQSEATSRPWHGGYSYWRYDEPTALVVPPTAAYHTTYAWGVGQVRSTPIHHQFGRGNAGLISGGSEGMFSRTPYWPSSTDQFGIYPVRAPW